MIHHLQQSLINKLWVQYIKEMPWHSALPHSSTPLLDHLAIIDLNSEYSGISYLQSIFETCGFEAVGSGYLPDKINDFIWMRSPETLDSLPNCAMPQIVLADFRMDLLSTKNRNLVRRCAKYYEPFSMQPIMNALSKEAQDLERHVEMLSQHMNQRFWPLPTYKEYMDLKEENELMSWVILFGRAVNHFGVGVYTLNEWNNLTEFNSYAKMAHSISLNDAGGEIKGSVSLGIEQSSTIGQNHKFDLEGGSVIVVGSFMEFVWRHSKVEKPKRFGEYYTGFIASNANKVIESVYQR